MHLEATWNRVAIDFKRRFQQIVIPQGYVYGSVGTAQKGRLLSFIGTSDTKGRKAAMVARKLEWLWDPRVSHAVKPALSLKSAMNLAAIAKSL